MKKLSKKEMKHVIGGRGGEIELPPDMGVRYTCYAPNNIIVLSGCFIAAPDLSCALCEGGVTPCYPAEAYPVDLCPPAVDCC